MAFEEKSAWIGLIVGMIAFGVYIAVLLSRAAGGSLPATPYIDAMLWSIAAAIIAVIVLTIVVGIVSRRDGHTSDVRDKQIGARAEYTSRAFLIIGALAALAFAMLEVDHFWIAHVLYLGFVLSGLLEGVTKIALYRGGVPAW